MHVKNAHGRIVLVSPEQGRALLKDRSRGYSEPTPEEITRQTNRAEAPAADAPDPYRELDAALSRLTKAQLLAYIREGLGGDLDGSVDDFRKDDLINAAMLAAVRADGPPPMPEDVLHLT